MYTVHVCPIERIWWSSIYPLYLFMATSSPHSCLTHLTQPPVPYFFLATDSLIWLWVVRWKHPIDILAGHSNKPVFFLQKVLKSSYKKVISINVSKLCIFPPFSTVYKSSQPSNFLSVIFFPTFSTDSKLASIFSFFYTYWKYWEKIFWVHISTFCELLS